MSDSMKQAKDTEVEMIDDSNQQDSEEQVTDQVEEQVAEERPKKKAKLPFGHFKVTVVEDVNNFGQAFTKTGEKEVVCKPLTQEDYANGWQTVLPRPRRGRKGVHGSSQPVHHWSVSLAQLPPHLWSKSRLDYDEDGKAFYPVIKDNIYHYTVTPSEHDSSLKQLNEELEKGFKADRVVVKQLVDKLDSVNGWLMIRARRFLKGTLDTTISYY